MYGKDRKAQSAVGFMCRLFKTGKKEANRRLNEPRAN